jgi:hypothetical protein
MEEAIRSFLFAIDWSNTYRPAAWLLLTGQSPYSLKWFYNPPWTLLPLVPLALLPETVGRLLLLVISFSLFALVAIRLGAGRLSLIVFLLSPPVIMSLYTGNLDALALMGAILPPWLGLFFLSVKPQIGAGLAFYWLVVAFRDGGPRQVARTFAPISFAFLLSLALYGPWLLDAPALEARPWNASLFPISLAIGLPLLVASFRRWRSRLALSAGPFLSPYLSFQSWSASLVALLHRPPELTAAVTGLWLAVLINMSG